MVNLLVLKKDEDIATISQRVLWTHDMIIQPTDTPGMYKVHKSRVRIPKRAVSWPVVNRQMLEEIAPLVED